MAVAYGAVVSLIDLIGRILAHRARRPNLLSEKQLREINTIKESACFIQEYLESHSIGDSNEAHKLKRLVLDVSNEAAYVIETLILDDIEAYAEKRMKVPLSHALHFTECIVKEMMKIEDLQPNILIPTHSSSLTHTHVVGLKDHSEQFIHVVGLKDHSEQIMDKLTGEQPALQVIPITGMGGIGKTTLAQTIYDNSVIVQSFDIHAWVTISQLYSVEQVLLNLLHGLKIDVQGKSDYHDLGTILHKHLCNRKYLIIVDDLWNTEAWDKLQRFLPHTKGSRIIVTTRLNEVANYVSSDNNVHEINLLDEDSSWRLLCLTIFGHEGCSPDHLELEEVSKEIAKGCKGLPLSIVVIGGLLAKSVKTVDFWKYVAGNVNKIIISNDNDCSGILLLSYKHLPIHLQPCFLYMGFLPENHIIRVSELVNLWVAEGFLKPDKLKTLEEVANEYLRELYERHLVMISDWGSLGTMKTCKVHDLLRDLCIRENNKDKFISANEKTILQSKIVNRLVTCEKAHLSKFNHNPRLRVVRVFNVIDTSADEGHINLLNVRFLSTNIYDKYPKSFSVVHRFWNLQTLVIKMHKKNKALRLPIWNMPHLRHFIFSDRVDYIFLDAPLPGDSALENLQTLKGVHVEFRSHEEVFRRIPNVKVLRMKCYPGDLGKEYHFKSYGHLLRLQSLSLELNSKYVRGEFIQKSVFPDSLKKLVLIRPGCGMGEISKTIGWLPHLEKLTVNYADIEEDWNPVEEQFPNLRILKLEFVWLVKWNAEWDHFPVLEHLHLSAMPKLEEIPGGIGEIETLESITLEGCKASVVDSAKKILEYQKSNVNEDFRLNIQTI